MKDLSPYLMFNGNAEEAFTFYQGVFDVPMQLLRFSDMGGAEGDDGRYGWVDMGSDGISWRIELGVLRMLRTMAEEAIRCLEAANQVRGTAGDYQVDGAKVAMGHAYGGAAQYFAMWIVSSELQPQLA